MNDEITNKIRHRLKAVQQTIGAAATEVGRGTSDVLLIAVSKSQPATLVRAACLAGHRCFGENRVQEAQTKWKEIREQVSDVTLHLIGPLQTNKVRAAVGLFKAIHTLDREKLARSLSLEIERQNVVPDLFIQINTGEEPQKAGILPGEADAFIKDCRNTYGLPIVGLMCIPPQTEPPALHFAFLSEIARRNGLSRLSMGMSADFQSAVRLGATEVRVGTAIFGPRIQT